jgi:signal transduction histidine kinase
MLRAVNPHLKQPARELAWPATARGPVTAAGARSSWFSADSNGEPEDILARSLPAGRNSAIGRHAAFWLLLGAISTILVVVPALPMAAREPHLSSALGAVSAVLGLALLQLGVLRFRLLRRTVDLHLALAFGVLALGNLFAVWASFSTETVDLAIEVSTYMLLLSRAAAAVLFLTGIALSGKTAASVRSAVTVLVPLGVIAAVAVGIVLGMREHMPTLLDSTAHALLNSDRPIPGLLPGQAWGLLAANVVLAAAMGLAATGSAVVAARLRDPHPATLAGALALLFFGQVQAIFLPSFASDYVTTGDAFRLVGYCLLVSNLMWLTAVDVADRTSRNERLRLSRELHDGLAQQLALLHLHLTQAAETISPNDHLIHELHVAQRLVESASLEARQAIVALRTDRVTCEGLDQALTAFADEFSQNHGVDVSVDTSADAGITPLDGALAGELLRVLHEACSNAIRHGHARRITAHLTIMRRALGMDIHDDGQGFDPELASPGLGLRLMAERVQRRGGQLVVDTAPGRGTSIGVCLPLGASAGR